MKLRNVYSNLDKGQLIDLPEFKDINSTTYPIAKKILECYQNKDISGANKIREENAEALKGTEVNAYVMFKIFEELYNLEVIAMSRHTNVYVGQSEIPDSICNGDSWFVPMTVEI